MASLNREAIYAALAARLGTITGLTVSRDMPPGGQPPAPAEQPIAFVPADKETPVYRPNLPLCWMLTTTIVLYARTDDTSQPRASALTPLIAKIEGALGWLPGTDKAHGWGNQGTATNLGGTCEHCTIGEVTYGEGRENGQGIAFIPISILAAAQQATP